jgi:diguanylate cyclase (GGDEF)-like protein
VLVVDLRRFAGVNDLYGHPVGDAVLVEVAQRLRAGTGPADLPARLAGDVFAVLTPAEPLPAHALATRLVTMLAAPYRLPGRTVHLSAEIGVADVRGAPTATDVLHHADLARRRARQFGTARVECYDASFERALRRRTAVQQRLPGVVGRGELSLVYQPVLDLRYREPVGAEALLRWVAQPLGPVAPAELVPVAEELELLGEVGEWVLHQACRQLSRWVRDGRDLWVSVNVTAGQLLAPGFLPTLAAALDTHCVPPRRLVVEVGEAGLTDDPAVAEQLAGVRALGVRTAIDRFGSGATALAHLRRLPVDVLKVDRALFTEPAGQAGPAAPIVDVVVGLGHRLGLQVIAVGLEDDTHLDLVRAAGCHYGQGFRLARPAHPEHVEAFLESPLR